MKKSIFKSIGAVAAGFLTVAVCSVATDSILEGLGVFPPIGEGLFVTWMLVLALAYRTVYTVAGGYVTAALAPDRPMRHVVILAVIGTVAGIVGAVAVIPQELSPVWYPVALAVLAFPSVWAGGFLYQVKGRPENG